MTMVQTALTSNVKGLVLATIGSGFGEMLTQAYDKKIPVVTFDSGLKAPEDITEGKNPIVAHVATDNKAAAAIAGEKMFEAVKADIAASTETYVVGVIQHDETSTGLDRAAGFIEKFSALADADPSTAGKYKVEKEVKPGDANQAYKEALEALYEKGVKACFMTNEGVAKQVYDAAKAAEGKYDNVVFAGFDAGTKQVTWIKTNDTPTIIGAVAQDSIKMGYEAVMQCIAAIEGGTPADQSIVGTWYDTNTVVEMISKDLAYTDSDADKAAILGN
jgi:ribose transport system substrate-binding protein